MSAWADHSTALLRRAADILFVTNPKGTSVGAFFGVCLDGAARLFAPTLARYKDTFDIAQVNTFYFLAFGVVLFNLPSFLRRRALPKEIEDAFEIIRRTKKDLTAVQVRLQYLALCADVIARATPAAQPVRGGARRPAAGGGSSVA